MPATTDVLAPVLASVSRHAEAIDHQAAIPPDTRRDLVGAGLYRLTVSSEFGGPGATLREILDAVYAVACVDGSVAWSVVHAADTAAFAPALPLAACQMIYANGPDVVISGSGFDEGKAVHVEGGYRLSGLWRWVPDLGSARWFLLIVEDVDAPAGDALRTPLRIALVPHADVEVVEPLTTIGLRGGRTGTIRLSDVFVPTEHTAPIPFTPCVDDRLRQLPIPPLSTLWYSAVALGIARGTLNDVVRDGWSGGVRSRLIKMAGENALAVHEIGELEVRLDGAWAAVRFTADALWNGDIASPGEANRAEALAIWALRTAVDVTSAAYHLGGDLAATVASPLQRRLRDMHTFAQHHRFRTARYSTVGAQRIDIANTSTTTTTSEVWP